MTASIVFIKKFIINPIKKSIKWYFEETAKKGNYICVTGTFPISYYEYIYRKSRNSNDNKN